MKAVEEANDELRGVLPRTYIALTNDTLVTLLREVNSILEPISGDAYGKVYEYFLGKFAMGEGQRGGQFFTPTTLVRLIVEIIDPYDGKIFDPACGSCGMFVQSGKFIERHREQPAEHLSIYGQERVEETVKLGKMNLAVNGLSGQVREANSYYEDPFRCVGAFDFLMANPPFNVDKVDKAKLVDDPRFPFGLPQADNANYLWIELFYSALNERGRAGFVMANSAGDARGSELEIRKQLIESGAIDVIVSVASNFFLTVTLSCTLWFLDKGKVDDPEIGEQVLFVDARRVFRQIDRAHRDFTDAQIEFLANIVRLYRGEEPEYDAGSKELMVEHFPDGVYDDVPGLCAVATTDEIEGKGWSLNPGRYVGSGAASAEDVDFKARSEELIEEFEELTSASQELGNEITVNLRQLVT
jgi:type I restriction enzyme M protein